LQYDINSIIGQGLHDMYAPKKNTKPKGKEESSSQVEAKDTGMQAVIQQSSATPAQTYDIPKAQMETGVGDALLSGLVLQNLGGLQSNPMAEYAKLAFDRYQVEQQRLASVKHQFGTPEQETKYLKLDINEREQTQDNAGTNKYQEEQLAIQRKNADSDAAYKTRMADIAEGKQSGNTFDEMFKSLSETGPFIGLEHENPDAFRRLAIPLGLGEIKATDKAGVLNEFNDKLSKNPKYSGAYLTYDGKQYVMKYKGNKADMNKETRDLFREVAGNAISASQQAGATVPTANTNALKSIVKPSNSTPASAPAQSNSSNSQPAQHSRKFYGE